MNETTTTPAKISAIKLHGHKIEISTNVKGQPVARLFKYITVGKNKDTYKLIEGFYFRDEARREEWVKEKVAAINQRLNDKNERQSAKQAIRANMQHGFEVGQIYYDSWGYDQTNIDFYQIVEVKAKSVVIRSIGGEFVPGTQGMDCSNVRPVKDSFSGEPMQKNIQFSINSNNQQPHYYIKSRHGWISLYEKGERGVYSSWYH